MKASELIKELQEMIELHGDCEIFSLADYEVILGVSFTEHRKHNGYGKEHNGPTIDLTW